MLRHTRLHLPAALLGVFNGFGFKLIFCLYFPYE